MTESCTPNPRFRVLFSLNRPLTCWAKPHPGGPNMDKTEQNVSPVYTPAFDVSGTPSLTVLDIYPPATSGRYTF